MKKESILFGIIGLLLGLIVGFMGANSLNKSGATVSTGSDPGANANMPPGHPDIGGQGGPSMQEIQAIVEKAKAAPKDFDAQMKAAEVYYKIGRYADAAGFLEQADSIKPNDPDVQIQLGNALFDMEKYPEAAGWYSKALSKRPDEVDVRTDYGITFMLREPPQLDAAIAEFNKVLKTKPGHLNTLQNLTFAFIRKGDSAKASATLAEVEKGGGDADIVKRLKEELAKVAPK